MTCSSRARISARLLRQAPQPRGDVDLLEQRLLLLGLEAQRAGDEVRQGPGIVEVGHRHLQLLGQVGHLLDDGGERPLHVAHERDQLRRLEQRHVGRLAHSGDEVGVGLGPVRQAYALGALDEDAQAPVGHLEHPGDDSGDGDVVELLRTRHLELGAPARGHGEQAVAAQGVVDELDGALLSDRERDERVGKRDRVAQGEHRQRLGQRPRAAHLDLAGAARAGADLDHERSAVEVEARAFSTGTLRPRPAGRARGSSMRRIPSS